MGGGRGEGCVGTHQHTHSMGKPCGWVACLQVMEAEEEEARRGGRMRHAPGSRGGGLGELRMAAAGGRSGSSGGCAWCTAGTEGDQHMPGQSCSSGCRTGKGNGALCSHVQRAEAAGVCACMCADEALGL